MIDNYSNTQKYLESALVVYQPNLSVLCESGYSLLCVVLWKSGADLQHIWLSWLGDHHGVV